jgi:HipA-like protein
MSIKGLCYKVLTDFESSTLMSNLREHLIDGARPTGELLDALGISREALSKAYHRDRKQLLRLGRARSTRYAARRIVTGLDTDEFPAFRVDDVGQIVRAGTLITLAANETAWLPDGTVTAGLPAEMHDIAPRGFLGRSYTQRHANLGLPDDVTNWSDHHVLIALSRHGEDLPGNLIIGRESFDRFQNLQHHTRTVADFPALSEAALAGKHVGSSAGGEQPKFTALLAGQHCLVKFATDQTDNARRWQDLLTLEHVALETLRNAGIPAAKTTLHDADGLRCLIVNRFDRIDINGRRAVMTLAAASGRVGISWSDAAEELERDNLLRGNDPRRIALLDAFGALIANTDRHLYNVLLYPAETGYTLAPAFDQLPMAYAPPASGNLRNSAIDTPRPTVNTLAAWDDARTLANEFWRHASEQRLSTSMQTIITEHTTQ